MMMEEYWEKIEAFLPEVTRPGRYIGNELNVVKKNWNQIEVSFALAFPDVYEIGMSHVGMKILYCILNRIDWVAAERVYSPWVDMEEKMRDGDIPLFSLESRIPISRFDILGITLQYELQYTNVINLLNLAGIELKAANRQEKDPIIVAGGPCAYNPEPMAEFFDGVVLGDGEEVVVEIAEVVRQAKKEKWKRKTILEKLSQLKGVYVPSLYRVTYDSQGAFRSIVPVEEGEHPDIQARICDHLKKEYYPQKPLVPMIEVTHDRFSLEIMRGCTRGCRFCNAGMIYRPVRERSVEDLVNQTQETLANTGYDEVSLVSLSTSDYCHLNELLTRLKSTYQNEGVSISFPSLRPDTFTPEIADGAYGLRRSGLTLAPEAGSQRLRDVINKNNREEDLLQAVDIAYQKGWKRIKLYYMIGLPTERQEDLEAMIDQIGKVVRVGRKYGKKEVHVSISPFCPKPQTPFQWESQDTLEEMQKKSLFLKENIPWREVKLSWRDPRISRLEAVLGRGDRRLGEVIYRVWKDGGRFDAWSDQFNFDRWLKAMTDCPLSIDFYAGKREIDDSLPWDHLSKGISKSFLLQERIRAYAAEVTGDCRSMGCRGCGLMEHPECRKIISTGKKHRDSDGTNGKAPVFGRKIRRIQLPEMKRKVRVAYKKESGIRFTSHLDTLRIYTRAIKRARIPMAMTQGYHVHPKIATGPPLTTGYTSRAEYIDLELCQNLPRNFEEVLNRHLPEGLRVFQSKVILGKVPSLNGSISLASYHVEADWPGDTNEMGVWITEFLKKNSYRIMRDKKGQEKEVDIRPFVEELSMEDGSIVIVLRFTPQGTARVEEVIYGFLPHYEETPIKMRVERTGLYIERQGLRMTPLEVD